MDARFPLSWSAGLFCALPLSTCMAVAQQPSLGPHTLGSVSAVVPLTNGLRIETTLGGVEQIVALREDVLRVRAAANKSLPEDASWAVLPEARRNSVDVIREDSPGAVGFHTKSLWVSVNRSDLRITICDQSGKTLLEDAAPLHFEGTAFRIVESMPADEHYFGLGDKTGPLDRRNQAYTMWNTDAYRFQESTDPLYKSIPFFMTFHAGTASGIFLDNTTRSSFDFGKESSSSYSFGAVAGPVDYYIFPESSPRQVVETYAWLTGKPPLPPRWMLGFQQSRYTYTPEARLMEIANRLRADRIPADALYLDIDYQDRNRPFTVNALTFPNLPKTLATLHSMQFHVVAITDLHIADVPGQGYTPFDSGIAGNNFLHRPDGSVYVGSVWPGPSVFPDFTRAQTRTWWGTLYKPLVGVGFDGFWNDMNEPSIFDSATGTIPLDVLHRIDEPGFDVRTATHAELHNVYGMENSRATYDGLRKIESDVRPFVLTRATYAGGQRYAATWTGDNSSTWNHLRMTCPMLKSLGLSGFSFSGADVGGFAGTATADLLTKWIEISAFQPIDRDHTEKGTGDQEPWTGGEQHENIRRRFIEERYRLMPYLYTLADETARTGMPMMRPLFLDYPDAAHDKHPIDIDQGVESEFLLGHDLLIAPSPYLDAPDAYTVEFPSAGWYNYWTGERVQRPVIGSDPPPNSPPPATEQIPLSASLRPSLDSLPVFVRAGAILPIEPLVQSTEETPHGPLTLRVYAGDDCRGSLYTDDGESFAFQRGDFLRMNFTCSVTSKGIEISISQHEGSFTPWWKNLRLEIYGWMPVSGRIQKDGQFVDIPIERGANFVSISVPDSGTATLLNLE
jgi:alpha-glucosidase